MTLLKIRRRRVFNQVHFFCSASFSFQVNNCEYYWSNNPASILPLTVSISQKTEVKCADGKDASIEASVSGGKGPFQFAWSGGGSKTLEIVDANQLTKV